MVKHMFSELIGHYLLSSCINMLRSLKYLADAFCRALGGQRGEDLQHSAVIGIVGRGGEGQRCWRARQGGMRHCAPGDGVLVLLAAVQATVFPLPRRLYPPRCLQRRLRTLAAAVSASRAMVDPRMPRLPCQTPARSSSPPSLALSGRLDGLRRGGVQQPRPCAGRGR